MGKGCNRNWSKYECIHGLAVKSERKRPLGRSGCS
jgi:hypothetical protein